MYNKQEGADEKQLGAFTIVIEDYLTDYYLIEIWLFENNKGADIISILKDDLRLATEEEHKIFQKKFKEYCEDNEYGQSHPL